jgi:hypothetical protein
MSALRGIIGPLMDKSQEHEAKTQALLKDIDSRGTPGAVAATPPAAEPTTDERPLNAAD